MWLYFHVVAAVCLATAFAEELVNSTEHPLRRQTRFGIVEGYADDALGLWVWRGLPFAKPPIGSLRWRAPEDLEPWEGVRTAKERAPECIQPKLAPPLTILPEATGSEDCLYLNIYRPQTREENLPVYVFLHGGGNVFGGAQGWYIQELARKANLVLVEVQYRLGPFGYFTHPIFRSGPPTAEHSGNFGTLDQIKALQWVRGNIAAFGGNPFNVTLGGHSGGGHDVRLFCPVRAFRVLSRCPCSPSVACASAPRWRLMAATGVGECLVVPALRTPSCVGHWCSEPPTLRTGNPNNAVSGSPEWQAWSNDEGGPKVLQLDAGLQHAQIAMDTQELSVAGVWRH